MLIESGAELSNFYGKAWRLNVTLEGTHRQEILDSYNSYFVPLFGRKLQNLDWWERLELSEILPVMCCGRFPDLEHLWQKFRPQLPSGNDENIWRFMLDEAVSLASSFPMQTMHFVGLVDQAFAICDLDPESRMERANQILLALISDFPAVDVAALFKEDLSNGSRQWYCNFENLLRYSNNETLRILGLAGANPNIVKWERMSRIYSRHPLPTPNDWRQWINEGADSKVLDWVLLSCASHLERQSEYFEVLLQHGANVNYVEDLKNRDIFGYAVDCPFTPLGEAVYIGNIRIVKFLLQHGADVLLDTGKGYLSEVARRQEEDDDVFHDLVELLEPLERIQLEKTGYVLQGTEELSTRYLFNPILT